MKNNKMLVVGFIALIFGAVAQIDASAQLIIFNPYTYPSTYQASIRLVYCDALGGGAGPYLLQAGETKDIEVDDKRRFYFEASFIHPYWDHGHCRSEFIILGAGKSSSWKLRVGKDGWIEAVRTQTRPNIRM